MQNQRVLRADLHQGCPPLLDEGLGQRGEADVGVTVETPGGLRAAKLLAVPGRAFRPAATLWLACRCSCTRC
jgi:hypothetical protein